MRELLIFALNALVEALQSTSMKANIIATPTISQAEDIVNKFGEDDIEKWKVGVRNGVEHDNWYDLIESGTYISDYQTIRSYLIATSDRLRLLSRFVPDQVEEKAPTEKVVEKGLCWCLSKPGGSFLPMG